MNYNPRRHFEKKSGKTFYRNLSLDSASHLCEHKEYILFLESQNRQMLEALSTLSDLCKEVIESIIER
jgi:hypothetical protein